MAAVELYNTNPMLEEKDLIGFASLSNLDKFVGSESASLNELKYVAYKANVIKKIDIHADNVDNERAAFKELIGAGLTNVDSFVNYARNNPLHSRFVDRLTRILTSYVNYLIKYVCGLKGGADDIVDEYEYLIKLASSNMSMRFSLNALNKYIEEICMLNKDNENCIVFDKNYIDSSLVYLVYKNSVVFTWAHMPLRLAIRNVKTLINDDDNIWTNIPLGTAAHDLISRKLDSLLVNRMIKVYAHNHNSVINTYSFYVFKTLTNDYNIVYV